MSQNNDKTLTGCNAPCCYDPMEMFAIAASISLLIYTNFNVCQINTINNLLTLVTANLAALITQVEINQGETVEPPF